MHKENRKGPSENIGGLHGADIDARTESVARENH